MNKFRLILFTLFLSNMNLYAHGTEAIVVSAPIIIYFLILPIFKSNWDYRNIIKNIPETEFRKKGLWIQNYLIGFITYILFFAGLSIFENVSEIAGFIVFIGSLFLLEIFGKSLIYRIFNATKEITYLDILKSIYKLNILILIVVL